MKISRKSVYQMTDVVGEYILIYSDVYEYKGPVALACFGGASGTEKLLSQAESNFSQGLMSQYQKQFQGQQAILGQLKSAAAPIVAQGINQYGFAPAEDSALRTQATEGTAKAYQMAKQATGENLAAVGGGNTILPTGTAAGLNANNAVAAAGQISDQNLGITERGYDQGRSNFLNATNILSGVSSQMNPLGYASAATGANTAGFDEAQKVNEEEQAAKQQMWSTIGGVVSGVATGGLSTGISALGKGMKG